MNPCVSVTRKMTAFATLAGALALAGAAFAGDGSVRPNYTFGNGAPGFRLQTRGGPVNPAVWVGFNPQPEPPGDFAPTASFRTSSLDLSNAFAPVFFADRSGASFLIELYSSLGDGSVRPLGRPNADNVTRFDQSVGGHDISVRFQFGGLTVEDSGGYQTGGSGFGDGGGAGRWFGAPGQRNPPGDGGVAAAFTLPTPGVLPTGLEAFGAGPRDVFVRISATVDGQALSFSATPEPATWAVMILGFGGAGVALRRRRTAAART